MKAKQARILVNEDTQRKYSYYLRNMDNDRIAKLINRKIDKAIKKGRSSCQLFLWRRISVAREDAIITHFSALGYDINGDTDGFKIKFYKSELFPTCDSCEDLMFVPDTCNEKEEKCKFCSSYKYFGNPIASDSNNSNLQLVSRYVSDYRLGVTMGGHTETYPVKYCPMCGRKLDYPLRNN